MAFAFSGPNIRKLLMNFVSKREMDEFKKMITLVLYFILNALLMLWYGFGGYKNFSESFDSPTGIILLYVPVAIPLVYIPLFFASKEVRKFAILGLLPPWGLIFLLSFGQDKLSESIQMASMATSVVAIILVTRWPLESIIAALKR